MLDKFVSDRAIDSMLGKVIYQLLFESFFMFLFCN